MSRGQTFSGASEMQFFGDHDEGTQRPNLGVTRAQRIERLLGQNSVLGIKSTIVKVREFLQAVDGSRARNWLQSVCNTLPTHRPKSASLKLSDQQEGCCRDGLNSPLL